MRGRMVLLQPTGDLAGGLATLGAVEARRLDQAVMCVERAVPVPGRDFLPARKVDQVEAAGGDDLRRARSPGPQHPIAPCVYGRARQQVAKFWQGEIHHAGETARGGDALEGHAAHAGGMEDRHLETPVLEGGFQQLHVCQAGRAERGHAHGGTIPGRSLDRAGGTQHRPGSLRQRGLADRVETIEAAGPKDHLDIGGQPLGRDQRREGHGRDHVFRHAERQRLADIQGRVSTHGTAQDHHAVETPLCLQPPRQRAGPARHDLHRGVFIAAVDGRLNAGPARLGHLMLGDVGRLGRIAQHGDIHAEHPAPQGPDPLGHVVEFVILGVVSAHDQDGLVGHRRIPRQAAPMAVSSTARMVEMSSSPITSAGDRIMFGPDIRAITPFS